MIATWAFDKDSDKLPDLPSGITDLVITGTINVTIANALAAFISSNAEIKRFSFKGKTIPGNDNHKNHTAQGVFSVIATGLMQNKTITQIDLYDRSFCQGHLPLQKELPDNPKHMIVTDKTKFNQGEALYTLAYVENTFWRETTTLVEERNQQTQRKQPLYQSVLPWLEKAEIAFIALLLLSGVTIPVLDAAWHDHPNPFGHEDVTALFACAAVIYAVSYVLHARSMTQEKSSNLTQFWFPALAMALFVIGVGETLAKADFFSAFADDGSFSGTEKVYASLYSMVGLSAIGVAALRSRTLRSGTTSK